MSEETSRPPPRRTAAESELPGRLAWLTELRWGAVAGVSLTVVIADSVYHLRLPLPYLYAVVATIAGYNLVFVRVLRLTRERPGWADLRVLSLFANIQICLDLVSLAALLHFSGGVENPLAFFFIFHVLIASMLLSERATVAQTTLGAMLFAGLGLMERSGVLPHYHLHNLMPGELCDSLYPVASVSALTLTLYLAAYFATSITRRLREREADVLQLTDALEQKASDLQAAYDKLETTRNLQVRYMHKVSHELRSPLAAIESLLTAIGEGLTGELSEKAREMVLRAQARTESLARQVSDLLLLARSKDALPEAQKEEVNFQRTIEKVTQLQSARAAEKNMVMEVDVARDLPPVWGDSESLEQLVTNLTANAIKYTPEGGTVRIRAIGADNQVRLLVSDTGIGVPEEDLPRIFDEFFRSKLARSFEAVGTGLGLSIVKAIVDAHQGEVSVESKVGEGTTFTIALPAAGPTTRTS